jgi:hypothetical protein
MSITNKGKPLDLIKDLGVLYSPPVKDIQIVTVPPLLFIMVDGVIPGGTVVAESPQFQQKVQGLYGISYTLKFLSKKNPEKPQDYKVMPLEGLWWIGSGNFDLSSREPWFYTLMIHQPGFITEAMFQDALKQMRKKEKGPVVEELRLETFHEGLSVQTMHVGPYSAEPSTIGRMNAYMDNMGYHHHGKHHEIYLGDPRRSAPEKLRTILRQPVKTGDG